MRGGIAQVNVRKPTGISHAKCVSTVVRRKPDRYPPIVRNAE